MIVRRAHSRFPQDCDVDVGHSPSEPSLMLHPGLQSCSGSALWTPVPPCGPGVCKDIGELLLESAVIMWPFK